MDELIDGTIDGWPFGLQLMRNPEERWVGAHCAAYTDENDNSAPDEIREKGENCEGDFRTKREAMAHARKCDFIPE